MISSVDLPGSEEKQEEVVNAYFDPRPPRPAGQGEPSHRLFLVGLLTTPTAPQKEISKDISYLFLIFQKFTFFFL